MKTKRTLTMCLLLAVCTAVIIGGTLAFMTDTASNANVFTLGNVDIALMENFDPETAHLTPGVSINKDVWIENIGKTDAHVWYTYAVPAAMDNAGAIELEFEDAEKWISADYAPVQTQEIDGILYNVYTLLYNEALPARTGKTSVSLSAVRLSSKVDYRDGSFCVRGEDGEYTPIEWQSENGTLDVIVTAYAIQLDGFDRTNNDNLQEAYIAYHGANNN